MDREEIVHRFQKIRIWKRKGVSAPHKPLLILYALGKLLRREDRLISFTEVDEKLGNLLSEFAPKKSRQGTEFPFWRLQNDGVWEIRAEGRIRENSNGDAVKSDLYRYKASGGISKSLSRQLREDASLVGEIAQNMLEAHFHTSDHERVLQAVGIEPTLCSHFRGRDSFIVREGTGDTRATGVNQQDAKTIHIGHANIDFRYWSDGRKFPLPSWAVFYMQLGAVIAETESTQSNLVTALAVPTRSYAAVLIAAGAIMSNVKTIDTKLQESPESHFEMFRDLPIGTSVTLLKYGKTVKGEFLGVEGKGIGGAEAIGVRIQNQKGGSLTEWLPQKSSPKVQISTKPWNKLPANSAKTADVNTSKSKFISRIFQGADLRNFVTRSTLDCAILGSRKTIEHEAKETKLSVGPRARESSAGTLQDILRIRSLSSTIEAFRSDIFSASPKDNTMKSENMVPRLVIFDGAVGFLKWRDIWRHCNWVVVLDRTEPRFTEAVQIVNEEYYSRIDEEKLKLTDAPPVSVELVSYTVVQ